VLEAIGLSNKKAQTTLRISVGKDTTESDIENAAKGLKNVVMSLRGAAAANLQAAKN
jgi:cysteine sulfinate desulfinase/cysteine desulfurase-like protein